MLEIAFAALLLAEESVPVKIEGLTESNLAAFAERVKAIKARRSSDAKEVEPVVKEVRLKDGAAIFVLQDKMELRLSALEKALERTDFKIDRASVVFGKSFSIVVSGMGWGGWARNALKHLSGLKGVEDAELDIRLRKESYVFVTLAKDAPGVSYPQVVEAVKKGSYKMDDLAWGQAPEFKGKRETGWRPDEDN